MNTETYDMTLQHGRWFGEELLASRDTKSHHRPIVTLPATNLALPVENMGSRQNQRNGGETPLKYSPLDRYPP